MSNHVPIALAEDNGVMSDIFPGERVERIEIGPRVKWCMQITICNVCKYVQDDGFQALSPQDGRIIRWMESEWNDSRMAAEAAEEMGEESWP